MLRYLKVESEIVPNTTPLDDIDADGLVLSGGAPRIGTDIPLLGNTGDYLEFLEVPILGICVGAQFTAIKFGGEAGPAGVPEYGEALVEVDDHDDIFKGLPLRFKAWESHNDEIKLLPETLVPLAHSDNCRYQAFKHVERPIYGVQFHPEVEHTEHGYDIFQNFIDVCKR